MLGHRNNKWTVEEEEALLAGIAKHGSGKWSNIVDDPEFAAQLLNRTNINLKDKWRNMKKSRTHTLESTSIFTSPSKTSRAVVSNEPFLSSSSDMSNDTRYDAMVFEAISTINDENGSNLKEMLSFIEVQNRYKISVTKATKPTLTLRPKDSTKPLELPSTSVILTTSKETREIDAAANRVAERINEWAKENNDWYEERQDLRKFLIECLTILVSQGKLEKEQHEVPQNFKRLLSYSLRILVSQDKLKKIRNRYKISVTKAMKPTLTLCPKDSTKPPELPSTSVILTTSKETQEIDAAANRVAERINELAKENDDWYEERQDFRMFLSECLTILVSQGKLEKVLLDGYKISELENKVMEVAPEAVAMKLAESDNKRLIAAEAVEEEERMHKLLEESHTMLQLCLEIHQQCALGEEVFLR